MNHASLMHSDSAYRDYYMSRANRLEHMDQKDVIDVLKGSHIKEGTQSWSDYSKAKIIFFGYRDVIWCSNYADIVRWIEAWIF